MNDAVLPFKSEAKITVIEYLDVVLTEDILVAFIRVPVQIVKQWHQPACRLLATGRLQVLLKSLLDFITVIAEVAPAGFTLHRCPRLSV